LSCTSKKQQTKTRPTVDADLLFQFPRKRLADNVLKRRNRFNGAMAD
jgi:hypothetical protein